MKSKLLAFFIIITSVLVSCNLSQKAQLRKELAKEFTVKENIVYHKDTPFAELQAMTWSLDGGELVKEFNFKIIDKHDLDLIGGTIDFLSERHQGDEIEVEFVIDKKDNNFKL